jgi:hypothetical protein
VVVITGPRLWLAAVVGIASLIYTALGTIDETKEIAVPTAEPTLTAPQTRRAFWLTDRTTGARSTVALDGELYGFRVVQAVDGTVRSEAVKLKGRG